MILKWQKGKENKKTQKTWIEKSVFLLSGLFVVMQADYRAPDLFDKTKQTCFAISERERCLLMGKHISVYKKCFFLIKINLQPHVAHQSVFFE